MIEASASTIDHNNGSLDNRHGYEATSLKEE